MEPDTELDAPEWFREALRDRPQLGETNVAGARIAFRSWGVSRPGTPDALLVHGGAAHARWWDFVAPLIASKRRVVAMDLSGHGDSDHRSEYDVETWVDEIASVLTASGLQENPVVVGHSLGGLLSSVLAARRKPALDGLIIVDSPIGARPPRRREGSERATFGNARVYPAELSPVERFRPVPAQETLAYTAAYVAQASTREVPGGWSWKFDPNFASMTGESPENLDGLACRVAFIAGERGILTDAARQRLNKAADVAVVEIPDAGHAIMLDQPVALIAAIRGILAGWSQSRPSVG